MDIRTSRIVQLLGSVKLALVLLVTLAVVTAVATLIESASGTAYAQATVYRTRWFEAVLVLLAINMIVMFLVRWPFPRTQTGFMITHFSVIVILIGAGITRFFGFEGVMTIREGSSSDFIYSREDHLTLSLDGASESSKVNLYKPGTQRIHRSLEVGEERFDLSIREYWPHMVRQLREGAGGVPMVQLTTLEQGSSESVALAPNEIRTVGNAQIRFLGTTSLPETGETASLGSVNAKLGASELEFDVPADLPAEFELAGQRIRLVGLNPDFKVGREPDPSAPMRNPALRMEITSTDGTTFSRQQFGLHPEFVMGDSLTGAVRDLEIRYTWSQNLLLTLQGTGITGVAEFPLRIGAGHMHAGEGAESVAPGVPFSLSEGSTLAANGFSLRLEKAETSAVWGHGPSADPNAPAGARVEITDAHGNRAEEYVLVGRGAKDIRLGDREAQVSVGPIRIPVGYEVALDDFVLVTYPGSNNPASFESHVRIYDPERGVNGEPVHIYMNHPLTYRGYKHFQSSYDSDRLGTVLSVNKDPGTLPTYIGYTLMTLGFLITLSRGLLWNRNPQPVRQIIRQGQGQGQGERRHAAAPIALILPLLLTTALASGFAGQASAQHHDHSGTPTPFLSESTRNQARYLIVQDYQGRMKPLDTYAREMVVKVTKRTKFDGWDPVDLYLSWLAQPRYWFQQPLISVRNDGVKHLLGIDPATKWISAGSLFDSNGAYRLQEEVEKAHRTPDRDRSKAQRKLLALDDQVNLLLLSIQGQSLKIFPVPDHPNSEWLGVDLFAQLPADLKAAFHTPFYELTEGVAHSDDQAVAAAIPALRSLQVRYGADILPSDSSVRSEIWLNGANPFVRVMALYGLALVLMGAAYVFGLAKRADPRYPVRHPLFLTGMIVYCLAFAFHLFGYILRWTASSHAPLTNGYESLIFISLATGLAGIYYESKDRRGSSAGLSSLLVLVILGVAMLPTFDPAISPIVPVLNSYWLIIHVTVITASYAFLGLGATMGMTVLILHLFKRPGADRIRRAVLEMTALLWRVLVAGLALLAVGTLLGGVWANESWGRYWGWDPKETWALVTILVYATVIHFRYIPALNRPWVLAAGAFIAISSVIMTYLGVNYLLSGLHSYGSGEATGMPAWVYYTGSLMALLVAASWISERKNQWKAPGKSKAEVSTGFHVPV